MQNSLQNEPAKGKGKSKGLFIGNFETGLKKAKESDDKHHIHGGSNSSRLNYKEESISAMFKPLTPNIRIAQSSLEETKPEQTVRANPETKLRQSKSRGILQ